MNKRLSLSACALTLALAINSGWAIAQSQGNQGNQQSHGYNAPEIDVGSGGSAIALIAGVMLVLSERSRRSSK
jgi:hypothetical protein